MSQIVSFIGEHRDEPGVAPICSTLLQAHAAYDLEPIAARSHILLNTSGAVGAGIRVERL